MWDDDVDREEYERLTYDYESSGYDSPPSKKTATDEYRNEMDSLELSDDDTTDKYE